MSPSCDSRYLICGCGQCCIGIYVHHSCIIRQGCDRMRSGGQQGPIDPLLEPIYHIALHILHINSIVISSPFQQQWLHVGTGHPLRGRLVRPRYYRTMRAQYLGQRQLIVGFCTHTVPGPSLIGDPTTSATLQTCQWLGFLARLRTHFFFLKNSPQIMDQASKGVGVQ